MERLLSNVGVAVWDRLGGLNCSAVGSPLRSLSRVVMSASESTSGIPYMCLLLFLNVFPCVFDVWEDLVRVPLEGTAKKKNLGGFSVFFTG